MPKKNDARPSSVDPKKQGESTPLESQGVPARFAVSEPDDENELPSEDCGLVGAPRRTRRSRTSLFIIVLCGIIIAFIGIGFLMVVKSDLEKERLSMQLYVALTAPLVGAVIGIAKAVHRDGNKGGD